MGIQSQAVIDENPFQAARTHFDAIVGSLQSADLHQMSHNEAEELILVEGREVMRRLLQAYLDLRSNDDAGLAVLGGDGALRSHRRERSVPLRSIVGDVRVQRMTYSARGEHSLAPLDAALNLPAREQSFGVQSRVAAEVARGSYDEAVAALDRQAGIKLAKHQAEDIAKDAAVDFDAFYKQQGAAKKTEAEDMDKPQLTVLTTDGKGIVMRPEGLRPATQAAAAKASPKLEKRTSKGEKRNRKRMALVASVYTIETNPRTPEDIIKELRPVQDAAKKRPRPRNKRVWASIEKSTEAVVDDVFQEALRRDPERSSKWVVLVDGNMTQLGDMLVCAEHYEVNATVVIDIIHVVEYLWRAAWCFHDEGSPDAETWVTARFLEILRGRAALVAGGIRRTATKRNLAASSRTAADTCADYLLKYKAYLRYDEYLAAGLPIATGVIEGACRYLVKDRMDITGARWSVPGAEAVLKLRALRASGDFEAYWSYHQLRELQRNHLPLYADCVLPKLTPTRRAGAHAGHLRVIK